MDRVVQGGADQPQSKVPTPLRLRPACINLQHWHLVTDESGAHSSWLTPPTSPTAVPRCPLAPPDPTRHCIDNAELSPSAQRSGQPGGACLDMCCVYQRAIDFYLENTATPKFRGRPRSTIATTLGDDLRRIGRQLCRCDVEELRTLDRNRWRQLRRDTAHRW